MHLIGFKAFYSDDKFIFKHSVRTNFHQIIDHDNDTHTNGIKFVLSVSVAIFENDIYCAPITYVIL